MHKLAFGIDVCVTRRQEYHDVFRLGLAVLAPAFEGPINRTPARAHACSPYRFYCIDLLSLELRGRNIYFPHPSLTAQLTKARLSELGDEPPTNLKGMVGVTASNGNHGRSGGPSRGRAWRRREYVMTASAPPYGTLVHQNSHMNS